MGAGRLLTKKIQDFPRPSKTFFHDLLGARQCLNIDTNSTYLLYIQSVMPGRKAYGAPNILKFISSLYYSK